jgi:lambda family phage portal protein
MYVSPKAGIERIQKRAAVAAFGSAGYITPGNGKNSTRGWLAASNHVDYDTLPVLDSARAGARDLWMNTPMATAALKRCRTNIVGFGLALQSRIDRGALGMDDKAADAWEENAEREFRVWAESVDCDIRRKQKFSELQALSLLSTLMSGDAFVLLPMVPRTGQPYDLRVQIIEADFVSNPHQQLETANFASGIETDPFGAPVAYHFRTVPQDQFIYASYGSLNCVGKWERVLAYGPKSGRRNVLHLMETDRPGQRRGMPFLAPVMETLKQLTRLSESELAAAVVASFFTVFIKNVPGQNGLGATFTDENSVLDPNDPNDANRYEMGPGSMIKLAKDESIEVADPKRPNMMFEPFFTAILKQIGASLEIPFEQLLLHFSASYSASRAALLEAWKFYKRWRAWLAGNFCQPVYEAWLEEAILKGRIIAPGFFDDPRTRAAWCGAEWSGAGQGQIDPLKETQAAQLRINARLSTYEDESVALSGKSWGGQINRLAREEGILKEKGLYIPPMPPQGGAPFGGGAQSGQDEKPEGGSDAG